MAAVGRNSDAFTFKLNLPDTAEEGVCILDRCGLVRPTCSAMGPVGGTRPSIIGMGAGIGGG